MRYLVGLIPIFVMLVFPQSASAEAAEEGASAEPNAEQPRQPTEPTRSRLERWHPEAFDDPSKPTSTPVYVDPVTGAPLAVPEDPQIPTAPRTEEQQRRRRIGIGVGVIGVVALILGVAVGVSVSKIKRGDISSSSGAVIVF